MTTLPIDVLVLNCISPRMLRSTEYGLALPIPSLTRGGRLGGGSLSAVHPCIHGMQATPTLPSPWSGELSGWNYPAVDSTPDVRHDSGSRDRSDCSSVVARQAVRHGDCAQRVHVASQL